MNQHRVFQTARRGARPIVPVLVIAILAVTSALSSAVAAERIFAANSYAGPSLVYEITGGTRVDFAQLNGAGYIGPLTGTADGRRLVVTHANGAGVVWVSNFDGTAFGQFQSFLDGVGDNESVTVVEMP